MSHRNSIISEHYLNNYNKLIKRTTYRVPNKSVHLAEECVQEAYKRALNYYETFNPKMNNFNKWFEGILRNAINDCRSIEKDRGISKELEEDDGVDLTPKKWEKQSAIFLLKDINNQRDKLILSLFLLYGYKTKDIAEYIGVSHTNVRQVIYRMRNIIINKHINQH